MANRMFNMSRFSLEKSVVDLFAKITIGGTGAPTLTFGKGITSVARNSAGTYTLTLDDTYYKLLGWSVNVFVNGDPAAPIINAMAETVASTKTFKFQCNAVDGTTATDPASGEVLFVTLVLSNSGAL